MAKSLFTRAHRRLIEVLVQARKDAGLLQAQLGERLGKDQSFISNIERGQRRVDVVEFCAIARALGIDETELFAKVSRALPSTLD